MVDEECCLRERGLFYDVWIFFFFKEKTEYGVLGSLVGSKMCIRSSFKGDYKRAEELRRLVMADARWSIESLGEGVHVVRIIGKARLDRFWVHERSGYDGSQLQGVE